MSRRGPIGGDGTRGGQATSGNNLSLGRFTFDVNEGATKKLGPFKMTKGLGIGYGCRAGPT